MIDKEKIRKDLEGIYERSVWGSRGASFIDIPKNTFKISTNVDGSLFKVTGDIYGGVESIDITQKELEEEFHEDLDRCITIFKDGNWDFAEGLSYTCSDYEEDGGKWTQI